ncbi:MAG: phage tail tape measure protein [Magnetococcales bacterium]|nr:phage tail tape measure protein [Magnetococcales bacterium]
MSAEQLAVDIARKPQETLVRFLETLKNLDKQTQVETLTKLFRREQADDMAVLLTGLERYKGALGLVATEANYVDTMEKKFSERLKTTESQLQLAKNAINVAGISIGMVFLPAVNVAAQAVSAMAQGIARLVNEFPNLSAAAVTAVTAFSGFGALRMAWAVLRSGILGLIAPLLSLGAAARAFMFTPLGAVLTAAGVAAYAFSKATESSIPPLLENASALGKSREETLGKIKSLETLKKILESTAPGTKEHTNAEEKLAAILPGANLSIDDQGRILAKVGSATRDNTKAMNAYLAELKQKDSNAFAMQLETQARALVAAKKETAEYADTLKNRYGIGTDEAQTTTQKFWLWMSKLTGAYDSNIAKGAELRRQLGETESGMRTLLLEAQKSGISVDGLSKAMDKVRADPAVKDQVVALYRSMALEAEKAAAKTASVADQLKQFSIAMTGPAAAAKAQIINAIKVTEEQTNKYKESLTKQREALKQAVDDQQKSWKAMADAASSWSKVEIDSIDEVYAARQAKLNARAESHEITGQELIAQTTSLAVAESTAKIIENRRYQAEALAFVNEEYRVRIANAERMKEDATRIDEERLQAQKVILEKIEAAYRASIDKLIAEERRHLEAARQLAQERANFNLSIQDKLANLAEKGMTPEAAYDDKQKRIAEEQKQAKAALDKGDYDSAKSHAERMIALAEQTSDAVVNGDRTIVTAQDAVAKSSGQIKAAAEIVNNAMKAQEEGHKKAAEEFRKQSASMMEDLDGVRSRIEKLNTAIAADHKIIINVDTQKIDEAAIKVDDLAARIKTLDTLKAGLQDDARFVEKIPDNVAQGKVDQVQAGLKPLSDSFAKFKEEFQNFDPDIAKNLKVDLAVAAIDGLSAKFLEFQTQINGSPPSEIKVTAETSQADSALAKVVAEADSLDGRVVTYYVNQVTEESHALGGMVGLARGGALPGWGGGDRIHALLEAGEFVVRKEAVGRYGLGLLESLNNMRLRLPEIPRFAFGGLVRNIIIPSVQRIPAFAAGGSVPAIEGVVRLELFAAGRPVASIPGPRQQIRQFVDALKELQRGIS